MQYVTYNITPISTSYELYPTACSGDFALGSAPPFVDFFAVFPNISTEQELPAHGAITLTRDNLHNRIKASAALTCLATIGCQIFYNKSVSMQVQSFPGFHSSATAPKTDPTPTSCSLPLAPSLPDPDRCPQIHSDLYPFTLRPEW